MRAIQFHEYGDAPVLHLSDIPLPNVDADGVRIRVHAIGVNPADTKWRQGMFRHTAPLQLPHVLGYDVAGVVDAVGSNVKGLAIGDAVFSMIEMGGYAEYAVMPADHAVRIPHDVEFSVAAALPTPGLTGMQMVEDHLRPSAGQTMLVTGAVGAVGRFAVLAAQRLGVRVVAGVRAAQREEALAMGVNDVVVMGASSWHGPAFDCVADTVGGPWVAELCRHLAADGSICTVATTPIECDSLNSKPAFISRHFDASKLAELAQLVAARKVHVPIALRMPLTDASHAHALMERGGVGGKIILEP